MPESKILETMTFSDYSFIFNHILTGTIQHAPYDDPHFVEYTKLNHSRMHRWEKTGKLTEECISTIQSISTPMHWILITEPWCGDAAHSVPFLAKMAEENPLIHLEIQLRDSEGSEIESYLTNGGKSIPILIVRNS
ncbi:MAG: thioredoxin family protein, partial [Cryomorphaceae bacterium]|nr:thioredoxin family protein [Cryomorphaceae bacterium]